MQGRKNPWEKEERNTARETKVAIKGKSLQKKKTKKKTVNTLKGFNFLAFKKENMTTTIGVHVPYLLAESVEGINQKRGSSKND